MLLPIGQVVLMMHKYLTILLFVCALKMENLMEFCLETVDMDASHTY